MKKTVAVFFGGRSPEHDISIITALSSVITPLRLTKQYTIIPVYITKAGKWITDASLTDIKTFQSSKIDQLITKSKPINITFDGGFALNGTRIDIAFPAMHGSNGEDGSLMGVLRMANIPFVGADMDASVIAMDKVLAKQVATANDIPTSKYLFFTRSSIEQSLQDIADHVEKSLTYPLFVKPAHLGSSIGISRVRNSIELKNALEVAAFYDEKIIVEEGVNNLIEVTVPIMGNSVLTPALVEKALSQDEFFDFDTKYMGRGEKKSGAKASGSQGYSQLPAELPDGLYDASIDIAKRVYAAIGATGLSRIDLLIDSEQKQVYFNEVNPLPGSLYAHNWRAAGVPTIDLVQQLIDLAEERFAEKSKLVMTFDSSFLKQF